MELTAREQSVLALVEQGCTNPEIAEALTISRNTVKTYLTRIYDKTGVRSRLGHVLRGRRQTAQ